MQPIHFKQFTSWCLTLNDGSTDNFLKTNSRLRELERRTESFNLFSALGVAEAEIRHSRLLAWLLNPSASHGGKTKYLQAFLELICDEDGDDLADYDLDLTGFEVECESDRIDIVLKHQTGKFVCAIENKVRIGQGDRQLETYRKRVEANYLDWDQKFVYLTLNGEKPADVSFIPIQYEHVLRTVLETVRPGGRVTEDESRALLFRNYAELINCNGENLGPSNIFEILHLTQNELKHSHFLAWLLNPTESHGLKDAFGRYLLQLLARKGVKFPGGTPDLDLSDAVVRREHEHIDILLVSERHRLVMAIENKIGAPEFAGQLASYHDSLTRHYTDDSIVRVFLDMQGRMPSHSDYESLSYQELLPFFESQSVKEGASMSDLSATAVYLEHYASLLTDHLWLKRKTKLPSEIQCCCEQLTSQHRAETSSLVLEVNQWQKNLGSGLEGFLYDTADKVFGTCVKHTWDVWYRFIPPALDDVPILSEGGADPTIPGRMAFYEFFVIPFGNATSVRKPGISLDVKLIAARPAYQSIKQRLHDAALTNSIFNRVKNTAKLGKIDPLLNYELCSFEEAIACREKELKKRIANRLERFAKSIHIEIVSFFKNEIARIEL